MKSEDIFGKTIHAYTRAMALADGNLIDVSATAAEVGWRWPVAITAPLWSVIETIPRKHTYQSAEGRLWDVVWMAAQAVKRSRGGDRLAFDLILFREGVARKYVRLIAHVGPGDDPAPVVTIGFPEDF